MSTAGVSLLGATEEAGRLTALVGVARQLAAWQRAPDRVVRTARGVRSVTAGKRGTYSAAGWGACSRLRRAAAAAEALGTGLPEGLPEGRPEGLPDGVPDGLPDGAWLGDASVPRGTRRSWYPTERLSCAAVCMWSELVGWAPLGFGRTVTIWAWPTASLPIFTETRPEDESAIVAWRSTSTSSPGRMWSRAAWPEREQVPVPERLEALHCG